MFTDALTAPEAALLSSYEAVIEQGLQSFVEVGSALMRIRDERLYRAEYERFEDYCQQRWSIKRTYAHYLIESSQAASNVHNCEHPVKSESHARELARLDEPEEQREVWRDVVTASEASGEPITAEKVRTAVARRNVREADYIDEPVALNGGRIVTSLDDIAGETYATIYSDPPWQYGNQSTRAATDNHYDTLTVEQLCEMPVEGIAADDAHLHLWTTNAFLREAFDVIDAWGFEYRSVFVWVKPQMGIGNYWRVSHEFLLLGIRGNAKRFNARDQMSWLEADRTRHSAKPEQVRAMIEKVSSGPYLEMFGREQMPGWTVMGNQISRQKRLSCTA